ncbi:MAG: hypothetical protein JEZ06_24230 [Anaerolineaceae bacterium]|nr:hypothetical protein [Anaerolineaceae bacterium]
MFCLQSGWVGFLEIQPSKLHWLCPENFWGWEPLDGPENIQKRTGSGKASAGQNKTILMMPRRAKELFEG